ncbi:DUF3304 domain-containing protein [Noviherbaspirillum cavernae]|uniref:DUF3304 domain-containing protein n=1 Tax=Noviherbaspirillum cavernae TaxID=2320862 RepID=A0A418X578_9BURK|nr:DUF3304 domain-containing protein [Noviherbaspirillum cavernae]RJG07633.1 DUF3304 domain-containing protein [Noviherbaspirillum cavernae]
MDANLVIAHATQTLSNTLQLRTMKKTSIRLATQVLRVISLSTVLAACSAIGPQKEARSGVGVHSINYSGKELSYVAVEDPKNPNNGGGGDALNPYGGGRSTICCFSIPDKWHPDLQVIVEFRVYPEKETRRVLVNVPQYRKPDDIWIMVHEGGEAEAVITSTEPGHPDWPGRMKDWPVPSREYRLKVWGEKLRREKAELTAMEKALQGDVSDLSPRELERLKRAIGYSKNEIKRLEGVKP